MMITKLNTYKQHLNKGLSLMFVGNILSTLLNVVLVKLLTNKFSIGEFGFYSLTMSITALPQIVFFAPLTASIFPFIKKKKDESRYFEFQKEIFDLFYFINIVLVLLGLLTWLANEMFMFYTGDVISLFGLTLIFSFSVSALSILDSFSLANSKVKAFIVFPIINLILKIIMIAMVFHVGISPYQMILIFSLIHIILFILEFYFLRRINVVSYLPKVNLKDIFNIFTNEKKEIFVYANNFFIWGVFAWIQGFLDKWILTSYASVKDVAIYSVYFQYGFFPFTVFSSVISQYVTPKYFSKLGLREDLYLFIKKLLNGTIIFLVISLMLFPLASFYIAPFLIKVLTNSDYLEHISYFPLVVIAGCFYCFAQILAVPLLSADLVKQVRFPKIVSSVLAVVLFGIMVPHLKILGIIIPLIIINVFYFSMLCWSNFKYLTRIKNS